MSNRQYFVGNFPLFIPVLIVSNVNRIDFYYGKYVFYIKNSRLEYLSPYVYSVWTGLLKLIETNR
jgi:hypothetical protein